jgi:hypothetical protein
MCGICEQTDEQPVVKRRGTKLFPPFDSKVELCLQTVQYTAE